MGYPKRILAIVALTIGALAIAAGPAVAAPSTQDTRFLQQAHQTNLAEISAGQLAQQKGNSQVVRDIGARLVTDHTRLDQSLRVAANALGVSLPSTPNAAQLAVARQLQAATGAEFDRLFVTTQIAGHVQAMRNGEEELANGSDPQAKQVATEAAPVIQAHHDLLTAAARQLGIPTSVNAGSGGMASPDATHLPAGILLGVGLVLIGGGTWLGRARRTG